MIVFDLVCRDAGHRFEGWFANSAAFEDQAGRGFVTCPQCGSADIEKALMAPSLGRKGNQVAAPTPTAKTNVVNALPPAVQEALGKLASLQAEALKQSTWVGDKFADQSRAIHYGEREEEPIHGQASLEEAQALIEEGIAVMPLPFPVAPPEDLN
ncbi:MAG: DUF1178 family protein [Novosphingobium sp.]